MKWFDILKIPLPHLLSRQKCLLNRVWICNWFHSPKAPFLGKLVTREYLPSTSHSHPRRMPHPCHPCEFSGYPQSSGACLGSWFPQDSLAASDPGLMAGPPSVHDTLSLEVRHEAQRWYSCSFVALKTRCNATTYVCGAAAQSAPKGMYEELGGRL